MRLSNLSKTVKGLIKRFLTIIKNYSYSFIHTLCEFFVHKLRRITTRSFGLMSYTFHLIIYK